MRLFTGIDLPPDIRERLDVLISHLRTHAQIKWSPTYNLHITTKFIGEWPAERMAELNAALHAVPTPAAISIKVADLGWYPNPKQPRIFWAGVHATPSLAELAHAADKALSALGIQPESRPYSPHLTLARLKEPVPLQAMHAALADLKTSHFGEFVPECFYLYRSDPGPTGSIYTKLREYPLPPK